MKQRAASALLTQAEHCLTTSIGLAQAVGDWEAVCLAAAELVECYGAARPRAALSMLCLHQSCKARQHLLSTFLTAADAANRQRLVLQQYTHLRTHYLEPRMILQYRVAETFLARHCRAWRSLDCSAPFDTALASVPSEVRLCVLPSATCLYVATTAPAEAGSSTESAGSSGPPLECSITRTALEPRQRRGLAKLCKQCTAFRNSLPKFMMNYGEDAGRSGDMAGEGDNTMRPGTSRTVMSSVSQFSMGGGTTSSKNYDRAEVEVARLLAGMQEQLSPALGMARNVVTTLQGASYVLLLPDVSLVAPLPLEGLSELEPARGITRDFGLHMLHNRVVAAGGTTAVSAGRDGVTYVADPRFEDQPDADEEGEGKEQGGRGAGAGAGAGSVVGTPVGEGTGDGGVEPPRDTLLQTLEALKANGVAAKWQGVSGADHIPSVGEWQRLLVSPATTGHVYLGLGRMLSYLRPSAVAGLSAPHCRFALVVAAVANDASSRRQAKLDNQKEPSELAMETPIETAALLTMTGMGCVVLNQWSNSFHGNQALLQALLQRWTSGSTLSEAVSWLVGFAVQQRVVCSYLRLLPRVSQPGSSIAGFTSGRQC